MAFVQELRKTVSEASPVLAAVGVTDLAIEKVRHARTQAGATRRAVSAVDTRALRVELTAQAEKAAEQVQGAPAHLLGRGLQIAGQAQQQYDALAARGEELVRRIREQRSTQDLLAQVDQTVAVGKGAVTTARHAVAATQQSALATFATGRQEVAKTADTLVGTIQEDVDTTTAQGKESVRRTRSAARKSATTARQGAAASTSRARATSTTARKTATRARKASVAGADKVGS
jgi:heparin binding hemagglutinin HbhA